MIEVNSTLKKRPPPRFRNMKPKLRRWSAKSVHSRWRLTGLKKRHGDLSIPTASSHPSSAAPWPLHPAGVSNDSTSAQYLLLSRPDASANLNDEPLVERIEAIQDELSGYGYRRITRALQAQGYSVNHKRIARIMKQYGLGIKPKRRFVRTTDSQHDWPIFPNLYCNQVPARPDQVWVADITFTVSTQDLSIWQ